MSPPSPDDTDGTAPESDPANEEPPSHEPDPMGSAPVPAESASERPESASDPAEQSSDPAASTPERAGDDAAETADGQPSSEGAGNAGETTDSIAETAGNVDGAPDSIGEPVPPAAVDSKWWYWVAAVPAYAAVGLLGGIVAFGLFILTIGIDVAGGMGLATGALVLVGTLVAVLYGLAGLVLFVMFPIGIYLDAQAIAEADVDWEPDPVLYGIVAVTTALFSALLISLVVAIYYLYRRNQELGVP